MAALKCIVHPDLVGAVSTAKASPALQQLFMSLVGAIAYALLTRIDTAVFVAALQRSTQDCDIIHVRRANAIVRWMQSTPKAISYKRLDTKSPMHLRCISDSAFKREEDSGHAIKGALFLRCSTQQNSDGSIKSCATKCHILDYYCRKQRHVTRSTFGAELFGACDGADQGMLLCQLLHEVQHGACSHASARELREQGAWGTRMILAIDAMSVFAATTAGNVKEPAEKALYNHVLYLRELLDNDVLEAFWWIDTRDMAADGLTKGAVERTILHLVMDGTLPMEHEAKVWRSKLAARAKQEKKQAPDK